MWLAFTPAAPHLVVVDDTGRLEKLDLLGDAPSQPARLLFQLLGRLTLRARRSVCDRRRGKRASAPASSSEPRLQHAAQADAVAVRRDVDVEIAITLLPHNLRPLSSLACVRDCEDGPASPPLNPQWYGGRQGLWRAWRGGRKEVFGIKGGASAPLHVDDLLVDSRIVCDVGGPRLEDAQEAGFPGAFEGAGNTFKNLRHSPQTQVLVYICTRSHTNPHTFDSQPRCPCLSCF